jgi:hypothetical protein
VIRGRLSGPFRPLPVEIRTLRADGGEKVPRKMTHIPVRVALFSSTAPFFDYGTNSREELKYLHTFLTSLLKHNRRLKSEQVSIYIFILFALRRTFLIKSKVCRWKKLQFKFAAPVQIIFVRVGLANLFSFVPLSRYQKHRRDDKKNTTKARSHRNISKHTFCFQYLRLSLSLKDNNAAVGNLFQFMTASPDLVHKSLT